MKIVGATLDVLGKKMQQIICYVCGKPIVKRNEIGLNKKLIDKDTQVFYCYEHLAEYFEVDLEFLTAKIEEFKDQGCTLFGGSDE